MRSGDPACPGVVPDVPAGAHPEGDEKVRLHVGVDVGRTDPKAGFEGGAGTWIGASSQSSHNRLEEAVAFPGILPAGTRREVNRKRVFGSTPVLEAGRVRQHVTSGDEIQARIAGHWAIGSVGGERRIESDDA